MFGKWRMMHILTRTSGTSQEICTPLAFCHDDIIKWKHFPRNRPFVRGIHRSPVNSPQKGQWRGALMFTFICARINGWVHTREAGDLRRYRPHYDVIVMSCFIVVRLRPVYAYILQHSTSETLGESWRRRYMETFPHYTPFTSGDWGIPRTKG